MPSSVGTWLGSQRGWRGDRGFQDQAVDSNRFPGFAPCFYSPHWHPPGTVWQTHHATEVSRGDIIFTQQLVLFPQTTRPHRDNSTRRSSASITSIPRAGRQGGSRAPSGAVLQRELALFPCAAHACLTACPPPGRGDSAWRRPLSSCKAEGVFAGQLASPLGYKAPGAASPAPRKG